MRSSRPWGQCAVTSSHCLSSGPGAAATVFSFGVGKLVLLLGVTGGAMGAPDAPRGAREVELDGGGAQCGVTRFDHVVDQREAMVELRSEERRVGKECRSRGSPD